MFGLKWGMGSERYLHWSLLYNEEGDGYMQRLAPLEKRIRTEGIALLEKWRKEGMRNRQDMDGFYDRIEDFNKDLSNIGKQ